MGRPAARSDCDELGRYVHLKNKVCSKNLLESLKKHHGVVEPIKAEVIEIEPEIVEEDPVVLIAANKIDSIKRLVCKKFGVSKASIESKSRKSSVVLPRQIVMYLARKHTMHSYPEIGRRLGGRDHTTIMHAFRKIEGLIQQDNDTSAAVANLEASIS